MEAVRSVRCALHVPHAAGPVQVSLGSQGQNKNGHLTPEQKHTTSGERYILSASGTDGQQPLQPYMAVFFIGSRGRQWRAVPNERCRVQKKRTDHKCLIEPGINEMVWGGCIRPAVSMIWGCMRGYSMGIEKRGVMQGATGHGAKNTSSVPGSAARCQFTEMITWTYHFPRSWRRSRGHCNVVDECF